MALAQRVGQYLDDRQIDYDIIKHRHTDSAVNTAHAAHLPEPSVMKAVVTRDKLDGAPVMAIIPASNRLNLGRLNYIAQRQLQLVDEAGLAELFPDCEVGAVPPLGEAYQMEVVWDDALQQQADVYLEAGDHERLIHLDGRVFLDLLGDSHHALISEARLH